MDNQESKIQKKISELRSDNLSGASELVFKVIDTVKSKLKQVKDPNANTRNKKVYALCDSFKYNLRSHFGEPILIEQKPSEEIYNKNCKNDFLEVQNYYFDITPPNYITKIISNLGILSVQDFLSEVNQDLPIEWFKYFLHNKKTWF